MSILNAALKAGSKLISPAEKAAADFISGASRMIPGETASGQTMLFPAGSYKAVKAGALSGAQKHRRLVNDIAADLGSKTGKAVSFTTPPFKPTGVGRPAPGDSARLARNAELVAKRKAKRSVPGSITPAPKRVPIQGPKPSGISRVDDLFGAGDKPLGFM